MNRNRFFGLMIGAAMLSAAVLSAQQKSTPSGSGAGQPAAGKTVTYVGCLASGGGADAYLLTNAKEKGVKGNTPRVTFKLAPTGKIKLEPYVTHEVAVTGTVDDTPGATASAASGDAVRTFTVTKVSSQSPSCG